MNDIFYGDSRINGDRVVVAKTETTTIGNNHQINDTSYYQLPCGKFLEDFIWYKGLNFAEGSALKYAWRAGKKDGESAEKDHGKMGHYIHFLAQKGGVGYLSVLGEIDIWLDQARTWDGGLND